MRSPALRTATTKSEASDIEVYQALLDRLQAEGRLDSDGVAHDPYYGLETEGPVLAMVVDDEAG